LNVPPPIDEEFWGEWIEQNVRTDPDTPYIDYTYMMPYTKQTGFKFAMDGLFNTPSQHLFGIIMSLNPPGSLYIKNEALVNESEA